MPIIVGDGSGDSKMQGDGKGVSIGTTDTTGRNAGVSTATGTLIYNTDDSVVEVYNGAPGWQIVGTQSGASGITGASGGTLVSPNPGGYELRHFPSGPTSFTYTSAGAEETIHVLVVAGGGGGHFGGGGGGGIAYAYNLPVPADGTTYPIAIGGGGSSGGNGGDSTFAGHPVGTITAKGGGGSTTPQPGNSNTRAGAPGGSGGGGGHPAQTIFGTTIQPSQNPGYTWPGGSLYQYGQPGGPGESPAPACCEGGGGGGAAGPSPLTSALPADFRETGTYNGPQASTQVGGDQNGGGAGGNGITLGWIPTGLGDSGYFGGGGGGAYAGPGGGQGGGGDPSNDSVNTIMGQTGQANTGGGGGASNDAFRDGGTGVVLVYYTAA